MALFLTIYLPLCLAMVYAMVEYSKAVVEKRETRRMWGQIYALIWFAIMLLLFVFIGDEIDRNSVLFFGVPAVIVGVHLLILRLATRR